MPMLLKILGVKYEAADYVVLQSPESYVKVELAKIVEAFKFDNIYDSMTGWPVARMTQQEMAATLDQIWGSELEQATREIVKWKSFPQTEDFRDAIETGIEQLEVRMIATMRPTPALTFQRDAKAMERLRRRQPTRIASYLLIRLLVNNAFAGEKLPGLEEVMVRNQMAIRLGEFCRTMDDTVELQAVTRQLIELDARFDISRIKLIGTRAATLRAYYAMLVDSDERPANVLMDLAGFVKRLINFVEFTQKMKENGNRAMQPAFIERTHKEIMEGVYRESNRLELKENLAKQQRERDRAKNDPNRVLSTPKSKIVITAGMFASFGHNLDLLK